MALTQVSSAGIKNAEVKTEDILDANITTAKIADLNVTTAKIAADAVTGAKIADDAVGAEHIEVLDAALQFGDSVKAQFGAGTDLELYHDGTDNIILSKGASCDLLTYVANGELAVKAVANGAVELYYDNSKKLETTSAGVKASGAYLADDSTNSGTANSLSLGSSQDLKLYFDASNAYCDFTDSAFYFRHNTNIKFLVSSTGAQFVGNLHGDDNNKIELGNSNDLEIYHNSSNYIDSNTTLFIRGDGSNSIYIRPKSDEHSAQFKPNGSVDLYYDGVKKFETDANGVTITGQCALTSHAAWPDHSSGYVGKAVFGNGDDLQIYHDGSKSVLLNSTGQLNIAGADVRITNAAQTESQIIATENGAVELYYDNSKKLSTVSTGVKIENAGNNRVLKLDHTDGDYCYITFMDDDTSDDGQVRVGALNNDLLFLAGGSERLRINSSGTVFIGTTTSHAGKFIVKDTDNSGNQIWVIGRANGNTGSISFRNEGDTAYTGRIQASTSAGMEFNSAGSTRASLDTSGNFIINDGNLDILTAGHGINFGATSQASGATSELFDDYEEGTWTPAVNQGVSNTQQFDAVGNYTKIGNRVHCQFLLQWSGTGDGNRVHFQGLPFTSVSTNALGGGTCIWTNVTGLSETSIQLVAKRNDVIIECWKDGSTSATTSSSFTNKAFYGRLDYMVA